MNTFFDLHKAIATSFDSKDEEDSEGSNTNSPYFHIIEDDEFDRACDIREYYYILSLGHGGDIEGDELGEIWYVDSAKIYRVFDEQQGFRFVDKCFRFSFYGSGPIEHSLQILGRAVEFTKEKLCALVARVRPH